MSNSAKSRFIALALLILITVVPFQLNEAKNRRMTRDAYLERQAQRYDRLSDHPLGIPVEVLSCGIIFGGLVGMYELLALGISKLWTVGSSRKDGPRTNSSPPGFGVSGS